MSTGLSIHRLLSFLEVVDHGAFTLAAPRNPIRQSQLSRQVGELEAHFGTPLLERRGRGIVVTPAGERLAAVVRELQRGLDEVKTERADAPLPFTFGAGDSLLQWWVVPRIAGVNKSVPRAVATLIALSSADVVARLQDARLDFGLVRADQVPGELVSRPLGVLEYALYVPRRLHDPKLSAADLLSTLPLALQRSEPELNQRVSELTRRRDPPRVALECETFPQARSAVRSGRYAALLPTIVDSDLLAREAVEVKLPGLGRLSTKLHLAWHPRSTRRNEGLATLARALEECLRLDAD